MNDHSRLELTTLLGQVSGGEGGAFDELVDAVYGDLRRLAAGHMARRFDHPLDGLTNPPTAIANQAVMDLRRQYAQWQNTEQFFAIATRLIIRLVLQYERERMAQKRGGGGRGMDLPDTLAAATSSPRARSGGVDLARMLEALHAEHPRAAEVVALHVVRGLDLKDVARAICVSHPTVERDWRLAKAWIATHWSRPIDDSPGA